MERKVAPMDGVKGLYPVGTRVIVSTPSNCWLDNVKAHKSGLHELSNGFIVKEYNNNVYLRKYTKNLQSVLRLLQPREIWNYLIADESRMLQVTPSTDVGRRLRMLLTRRLEDDILQSIVKAVKAGDYEKANELAERNHFAVCRHKKFQAILLSNQILPRYPYHLMEEDGVILYPWVTKSSKKTNK